MRGVDRTKAKEAARQRSLMVAIAEDVVAQSPGGVPGSHGNEAHTSAFITAGDLPATYAPESHNNTAHSATYITAADLPATYAPSAHDQAASTITTTTTGFGGELSAADDTVQKALDTLDDHTHPAGTGGGVLYDLQANRPAAGTDGRLFFATDGYFPQVDNGATWDTYVDGFKCSSPPASGSLSVINGTDIVLTDEGDGLLYQGNGNGSAGNKYSAGVVAIPAEGAYTFTMGFDPTYLLNGEGVGICLTDGTGANAKMIIFHCFNSSNVLYLYGQYVTAPGTFNSTPVNVALPVHLYFQRLYLRIADDRTTNLVFSYNDKFRLGAYTVAGTLAREAWLTPGYAGACGMENAAVSNGLIAKQMKIFHWSLG